MSDSTIVEQTSAVDQYACEVQGVSAIAPDGSTTPIDKCAWFQVAPCSCVNGVIMAMLGDRVLLSADAAMQEMAEGKISEAKRDVKLGFRMVLVRMDDYRDKLGTEILMDKCPHIPTWGYEPTTRTVDGVVWTRRASDEWFTKHGDQHVTLSKWGGGWRLSIGNESGHAYMDARLPKALERAASVLQS